MILRHQMFGQPLHYHVMKTGPAGEVPSVYKIRSRIEYLCQRPGKVASKVRVEPIEIQTLTRP